MDREDRLQHPRRRADGPHPPYQLARPGTEPIAHGLNFEDQPALELPRSLCLIFLGLDSGGLPHHGRCPGRALLRGEAALVQHPGPGGPGDRVAAASPQDVGERDRDHRPGERPDDVDPVAREITADEGGPDERAGFIETPLTGAAQRPASAM